jgi:putative FmdB family regulatory protein
MPIYEFKCESCGKVFETLIRNECERASLSCPACNGSNLERLLSSFSSCGAEASDKSSCPPARSKFG